MIPLHLRLHRALAAIRHRFFGPIVRFAPTEPVVALTFDDGPSPEFTPPLLRILDKYKVPATFFMLGEAAERDPGLVSLAAGRGHSIGNHSWSHPNFPALNSKARRKQLIECQKTLGPTGRRLFRPPYGSENIWTHLDALWLGFSVVNWSVDGQDWTGNSADAIAGYILGSLFPGAVILLHDGLYSTEAKFRDRGPTLDATAMILETLAPRYRFITIPEMLRRYPVLSHHRETSLRNRVPASSPAQVLR